MGRIRAPFGIKGWVKVQPFTQRTEGLLEFHDWWLESAADWQNFKVAEAAVHGAAVIARFDGIEDRDAAFALRGREIAIPRSALPAPEKHEYYLADLIGLEVWNLQGERLGQVERLLETGANPVIVLNGDRERLLPFVDAVVRDVDLGDRRMVVDWGSDY